VPPCTVDAITLDDLKRQAIERAESLGHRLQPFRGAKNDRRSAVSFCADCRQMVIVSLEDGGVLYGYALETRCSVHAVGTHQSLVAAGAR
jgi:hypothetical protein